MKPLILQRLLLTTLLVVCVASIIEDSIAPRADEVAHQFATPTVAINQAGKTNATVNGYQEDEE